MLQGRESSFPLAATIACSNSLEYSIDFVLVNESISSTGKKVEETAVVAVFGHRAYVLY
jgi:hypothetical protein